MASQLKAYSPKKTSPSSLLSSDVDEDLGLIDFSEPRYDFLNKDEFWLFEQTTNNYISYDKVYEMLESFCVPKEEDEFFLSKNAQKTPTNGLGRFDYLTKSVSRTATITRRKIDNVNETLPSSKFGTITKRVIHPEAPKIVFDSNPVSQKFNLNEEICYATSDDALSENFSNCESFIVCSNVNTPNAKQALNDTPGLLATNRVPNVNTNTITKNRRSFVCRPRYDNSFEIDNVEFDTTENFSDSTCQRENFSSASDDIANNVDLCRESIPLNRTYDKYNSDTDESSSIPTQSSKSRNYPTISRNVNRNVLCGETSQGDFVYSNPMKQSKHKFGYQSTASNDDLLSSSDASSSHLSLGSNLAMTSSITGRSEPNLAHGFSRISSAIPSKKLPARMAMASTNKSANQLSTKIAKPLVANKPASVLNRKPMSKLPGASSNTAFGSVNSLQTNGMRTASQSAGEVSMTAQVDIDDDGGDHESLQAPLLLGSSSKLASALSRNSTFRVHRPTPIVSAESVFTQEPPVVASAMARQKSPPIKCCSDDNILHCSQDEIDDFRAKVVLNSSNGNLRAATTTTMHHHHHHYSQYQSHATKDAASHPNRHLRTFNRSNSPSSNSSSCSSTSPTSSSSFGTKISNRLNNNNNNNENGPVLMMYPRNDSVPLSLTKVTNINNNQSSSSAANNNFTSVTNGNRTEIGTNSKANCRIPGLPKSVPTIAPNRSGIPVSGIIPKRTNPTDQTSLLRDSKLAAMAFHHDNHNATNKVASSPAYMSRKLMNDNSWQNDCF